MQREATLIGADIQRLAMSIPGRCYVVLALVEKGSGLLSAQPVIVKLHAVHAPAVHPEDRCPFAACCQCRIHLRQLFKLANALVYALYDIFRTTKRLDRLDNDLLSFRL